ncbi:spore cortex-lytic enzyme [Lederbergia wuyishanensis]|uniref:Spore cortex-lytic enzyme n=1 Tax=Lederbergia wuyishanensis TaxID=1347903 RepID=A0ABU0D102_9BACI|nr:spore cortex-lytic enzyme [Lederbergia wuyishanensis]MCJ8006694.1 spore cortex-lytic enzyme [Lederbergia wuyishanensis]MDQ0342076.1 N-acetylmuramoyl-L-alanine amidase [Lederbergia wuyishanensis]
MRYYKMVRLILLLFLCTLMISTTNVKESNAFTNQVIQLGAVGDDVIELQARLQYIGFYTGKIDGVFGWGTYWALRNFQNDFGMKVDGLAGSETKEKLVKASKYNKQFVKEQINKGKSFSHYGGTDLAKQTGPGKNTTTPQKPTATNTPTGFSQNDINLMANAVHGEARGEPYEGQVAVAAVILNRVNSASFPNTVAGVIFEPGAFTAVADGQIWLTPNETSKRAVLDAINGWDPSTGALYYFNPNTATSAWIWTRPQIKQIGEHIFCM